MFGRFVHCNSSSRHLERRGRRRRGRGHCGQGLGGLSGQALHRVQDDLGGQNSDVLDLEVGAQRGSRRVRPGVLGPQRSRCVCERDFYHQVQLRRQHLPAAQDAHHGGARPGWHGPGVRCSRGGRGGRPGGRQHPLDVLLAHYHRAPLAPAPQAAAGSGPGRKD